MQSTLCGWQDWPEKTKSWSTCRESPRRMKSGCNSCDALLRSQEAILLSQQLAAIRSKQSEAELPRHNSFSKEVDPDFIFSTKAKESAR